VTYLELCQRLRQEVGVSGTGPTAVTSQTGELKRLVDWVASSYTEIQNRHEEWRWLRVGFSVDTVADDDSYAYGDCTDDLTSAAITRFTRWRFNDQFDTPKIYLTSAGSGTQNRLIFLPWDSFATIYRLGQQTSGYPAHITIDPQDNMVLGPKPNDVYTINADYFRSAQELASDSEVPEMPSQYHMLIVYRAIMDYGLFESAAEVIERAELKGSRLMRQLEKNQLPKMRIGAPMA
jgi:hypothetical protein